MTEPEPPPEPGVGAAPADKGLAPGTVIADRYRIDRLLGTGGMGSVYLATHLELGREEAIKVLRSSVAGNPSSIARFRRGAQNAGAFRHVNVCTIHDFFQTAHGYCLAMEYVPGVTLQDLVARYGVLRLDRSVVIVEQVAAALEAAHAAGIIHRDLKPANIMLTAGDAVKVVDFDISKGIEPGIERGVTTQHTVIGTPEYMSPEQLKAEPLDRRSDVYSLALVFYYMFTGATPYRSDSREDLWTRALSDVAPARLADMKPDEAFPAGLQDVLDRALRRRPETRTASAARFAAEIRRVTTLPADAGIQPSDPDATRVVDAAVTAADRGAERTAKERDVGELPEAVTTTAAWHMPRTTRHRALVAAGVTSVVGGFLLAGWLSLEFSHSAATDDHPAALEVASSESTLEPDEETGQTAGEETPARGSGEPIGSRSDPTGQGVVPAEPSAASPPPVSPVLAAHVALERWDLFEQDFTPGLRFNLRYGLESPRETAWCLAVRYRDESGPIRSGNGAFGVGGMAAAHRTLTLGAGQRSGVASVSIPLDRLGLDLDRMHARVRLEAWLAVWPRACASVSATDTPVAQTDAATPVCLIRGAAGLAADPVCR